MINGHRVVAWTPYGREPTVSILLAYMERDHARGIVDEWWLCLNTDPQQVSDLRYAYDLARRYSWIKIQDRPAGCPRKHPKQRNTGYFYRLMTDRDTVYVRFDDDIIYVHDDAVTHLVRHKLESPQLCSFALIANNAIVSWYLQAAGVIPAGGTQCEINNGYVWPRVGGPYCMDPVGWADGAFAVALHRLVLDHIKAGTVEDLYLYQDYPLQLGQQFSVSCFASLGSTYADLPQPGVLVPDEEESWHTTFQPHTIGIPNVLVGNAVVSHYTFFPQQGIVNQSDILDRYAKLATDLRKE